MPWGMGATELLIILGAVMVLFGYKKLPEAGRSLGRSMRIFKSEVREMKAEGEGSDEAGQSLHDGSERSARAESPVPPASGSVLPTL
jgi:sec-independent protein translocase protein TatA